MKTESPRGFPLGSLLSFLGPFAFALSQAVTSPLWRSDATARALAAHEWLLQGAPSAVLARACAVLPLGQSTGRGTLVGACAVGFAGLFVYRLARDLALRHGGHSPLDVWLALGAAWSSTLGGAWLTESIVLGGAAPGAAGALGLLCLLRSGWVLRSDVRAAGAGALLGTLLAESVWAGAAVLLWTLLEPPRGLRLRSSLGALAGVAIGLGLWLGPSLPGGAQPLSWHTPLGAAFPWSLEQLVAQVGILFGLAALFALGCGIPRAKSGVLAVALVLLFDWCAPLNAPSELLIAEAASGRHALHLVALGLWAALGSLGLRMLGEGALALRLYGARAVRPLTAVLGLTAALAGAEDARSVVHDLPLGGAQAYADATLNALPARAIILTHSSALTTRLLSAQAAHARPDVLIVPLDWLGQVRWMRRLVATEPRLEPLIRDLNVMGTPSEHALNLLADVRPVFVEANETWDRRLLEHLVPLPLLAGFSPHALGRSDRLAAWEAHLPDLAALQASIGTGAAADQASADVARTELLQLEAALAKAGDRKMAAAVGAEQSRFRPASESTTKAGPGALLAQAP